MLVNRLPEKKKTGRSWRGYADYYIMHFHQIWVVERIRPKSSTLCTQLSSI